jgi:glutathione S-transferase/translation elongation factor EF-1beta
MKLYSNNVGNFFAQTALVAADLANAQVSVEVLSKEQQNDKEFKAKNVNGKFPLLELESGELIFESAAIANHFARSAPASGLMGQTPFQTAQVHQWTEFTHDRLLPAVMPVAMACLGHTTVAADVHSKNVATLKAAVKVLNSHFEDNYFLVGDNLTISDVVAAGTLILAFQTVLDAGFRKSHENVADWFSRVTALPSFVRRCGYVRQAQKAMRAFNPNATPEELAADVADEPEDELDDLFGDDAVEEKPKELSAGQKKAAEMKAKAKASAAKKKEKKPVIAKSSVMFEVKPLDDTTNLDDLYAKIGTITMDGLVWGLDMKKVPVAFGIFKLLVACVVEDEKVSVDDVQEKIEAFEDMVQSVEIAAFNKI